MSDNLSQSRLKTLLHYNRSTGLFTWRVNLGRAKSGQVAQHKNSKGYIQIQIDGVKYLANRLAFLYVTGNFPTGESDHVDGNPTNNCWDNLRDLSRSENQQNIATCRAINKSKRLGVHQRKSGAFVAQIQIDKKKIYLGQFESADLAYAAYLKAKAGLHPASCRI